MVSSDTLSEPPDGTCKLRSDPRMQPDAAAAAALGLSALLLMLQHVQLWISAWKREGKPEPAARQGAAQTNPGKHCRCLSDLSPPFSHAWSGILPLVAFLNSPDAVISA